MALLYRIQVVIQMEYILNLFTTFNGAWNDSEKDMPPTAVILPGETHGPLGSVGHSPCGGKEI